MLLLLLVFADHVHDDDHGDDDHWSGGVAVLLRLPNLPVDHLNTFSKCTNTEHNRSTNNNSITLGKATRPKQKRRKKSTTTLTPVQRNRLDWLRGQQQQEAHRTITYQTGNIPAHPWLQKTTRWKDNKKRFLLLSKHVVAVVVAVILGHVSLIWLHGYLGFFLFVQNYQCLHSHGWMAMPLLLPRCLFWNRRHVHIVFMLPSSSVCAPSLLWPCSSNCGILNSMEDIADRSLLGWRIN